MAVELNGFPRAPLAGGIGGHGDSDPDLSGMPRAPHVSELREQLKASQRQALLNTEARLLPRKEETE